MRPTSKSSARPKRARTLHNGASPDCSERNRPDEVDVVGKHDGDKEPKRLLALDKGDGLAKPPRIRRASKPQPTLVGHQSGKAGPARHKITSVVGHPGPLARCRSTGSGASGQACQHHAFQV